MKTKIRVFLCLVLIPLIIQSTAKADSTALPRASAPSYDQTEVAISAKQMDPRAIILQSYLAQYNSPLQYHAQDFVEAADANNIDWKLVAAISGVESTFGKQIPGGYEQSSTSYNAWGWGVYGTQALYFKSWKDGIYTVSAGLRNNYFNKGYTDPYSINKIYAASPTWGYRVSYFLADMNQYQAQYATASTLGKYSLISFPTTDSSAILALEKNFN